MGDSTFGGGGGGGLAKLIVVKTYVEVGAVNNTLGNTKAGDFPVFMPSLTSGTKLLRDWNKTICIYESLILSVLD